jgi:hypothetical protein
MSDDGTGRRWPSALGRAWRWKPASQQQVWLLAAADGLLVLIILTALGNVLIGLPVALAVALGFGASQSYRLNRRADAAVASDWADARSRATQSPDRDPG